MVKNMEKLCYIRFNEDWEIFYDNRYIQMSLINDCDGKLCCILTGQDDWEVSYTGPDADLKFNALLELYDEVNLDQIIQLGFTQYG